MKRFILILTAALLAATTAHAGWWRTYGGRYIDVGYCVQKTSDGNYVICGRTERDFWLFKTDTIGEVIWEYILEEGSAYWVEETSDSSYIVAGSPDLLKFSAQGDTLWSKDYGISSTCVEETNDGGYILTGSYGNGDSLALIKTDPQGNPTWMKSYNIEDWDLALGHFVRQTTDGGYIVTGVVSDTYYVASASYPFENEHFLLLKTDSLGDTLWTKVPDTEGVGYCVRQLDNEGYIVTGSFGLLKTDSLGEILWRHPYGGFSVQITEDGGYIVTGNTLGGLGSYDLWLLKTDSLGDTIWTRIYGGENHDEGRCVQQMSDGGYIVVGKTSSFGAGFGDVYLLRTDSLGFVNAVEEPIYEPRQRWYLVKTLGQQIVIQYCNSPQGFEASIFDVSGQKIDELYSSGSSGSISWGTGYPSGIYFIVVAEKNQVRTAKVVLIH